MFQHILSLSLGVFLIYSCTSSSVKMARQDLYAVDREVSATEINGFRATSIFDESMDKSFWVSPEKQCVTAQAENKMKYSGEKSLHLKWDKISGGCDWIGIGFGWNNWRPKDISQIIDIASIEFYVRSAHGSFRNLPVAFALEDYTGVQTYYGFNYDLVEGEFTEETWQKVRIPLSKFPFDEKGADPSLIKQFMIQLEGDGDIYLDNINIVRNENS